MNQEIETTTNISSSINWARAHGIKNMIFFFQRQGDKLLWFFL